MAASSKRKQTRGMGSSGRSAIFPATELNDQSISITKSQNSKVMVLGRLASDAGVTAAGAVNFELGRSVRRSFEHFALLGECLDAIEARGVADSWRRGHTNCALGRDFYFRLDDVFGPIAAARRDVAGKREIRQRRHGDVVCATDARFQHTATPDRDGFGLAEIVDSAR